MANQEYMWILERGCDAWNEWRKENPDTKIDLRRADLRRANLAETNLREVDFTGADLRRANLTNANLMGVDFAGADLEDANLVGANLSGIRFDGTFLTGANFTGANLRGANLTGTNLLRANLRGTIFIRAQLRGAYLREANFRDAFLTEADFSNASLSNTIFVNNNLGEALNLGTIVHLGPSSISTDTLRLSGGKIPVEFLRGCGLSDWEIESAKLYSPGLDPEQVFDIAYNIHKFYIGRGIQYYSCFISYNSKDQEFAQRLHDNLQNNGVRCWFAPEDMKIGDQIRPTIDQQIRLRDKLLVILSENSVESEWVGDEVEAALEEESASERLVLFPIRLDDAVMDTRDDWAAKVKRRRHIGDFSNWKDEGSYKKAFERLLRDLKAGGE